MAKIPEIYAFTALDPEGNESLVGLTNPQDPSVLLPLVAASLEGMDRYRPFVQKLAEAMNAPVTIVKFTTREEVETIS